MSDACLFKKDFTYLLSVVKEFLADLWEVGKLKLYGDDGHTGAQSNSSGWDLGQYGELE